MEIRHIISDEIGLLTELYQTAFSSSEGEIVGRLASDLSLAAKPTAPPNTSVDILSLGSFKGNQLVGHIGFSPLAMKQPPAMKGRAEISGYILAPLAVHRAFQRNGIGRALIEHGKSDLCSRGVSILLVYGDPNYYGRFGFKEEIGQHFLPPYTIDQPHGWLGLHLDDSPLPKQPLRFDCVPELHHQEYW